MSSLLNVGVDSKYALELGISNVTAILGRKCTVWLKANQKTRSPPLRENLNLEKEYSVLFGELNNCTVTFNGGSKQFRLKVYILKCVIK